MPAKFEQIDDDRDGHVTSQELVAAHAKAADELPNFAIPEMNGVGAMELPVSVAEDPLSCVAMGTGRAMEDPIYRGVLMTA